MKTVMYSLGIVDLDGEVTNEVNGILLEVKCYKLSRFEKLSDIKVDDCFLDNGQLIPKINSTFYRRFDNELFVKMLLTPFPIYMGVSETSSLIEQYGGLYWVKEK